MKKPPERFERKGLTAITLGKWIGRHALAARFVEGQAVLDIACGTGEGTSYLMHKGAKTIVGADYSEEAIEYARRHYQKDGLYFLQADAQQMPFPDNSFDVIVSLDTIEHLKRYEDFLKECRRVLKDGGIFICSTPNRRATIGYKNPFHFKEFSVEEFYKLITRYFGEVELYGQDFLTKIDIIKKEFVRNLGLITPFIPQTVKNFVKKLIFSEFRHMVSSAEVDSALEGAFDRIVEERYHPIPLNTSSPLIGRWTIAVARKRDG